MASAKEQQQFATIRASQGEPDHSIFEGETHKSVFEGMADFARERGSLGSPINSDNYSDESGPEIESSFSEGLY